MSDENLVRLRKEVFYVKVGWRAIVAPRKPSDSKFIMDDLFRTQKGKGGSS